MANEIHNSLMNTRGSVGVEREKIERTAEQPSTNRAKSAAGPAGGDRVSLTDTALKLREHGARLAAESPVDTQRVERIREELAAGTYKIDAEQIADKLLSLERDLGVPGSR